MDQLNHNVWFIPGRVVHSWFLVSHWQFWSVAQLLQLVFLLHTKDGLSFGHASYSIIPPCRPADRLDTSEQSPSITNSYTETCSSTHFSVGHSLLNVESYRGTGAVTMTRHTDRSAPLAAVSVRCAAVAVWILLTLFTICIWKAHIYINAYKACGSNCVSSDATLWNKR